MRPGPRGWSKVAAARATCPGTGTRLTVRRELEAGDGEGVEVAVAGEQRQVVVEAGLGDEGIAEGGFASQGEELGAQQAGALPVARSGFEQDDGGKLGSEVVAERGAAEELGQHGR